MLDIEKSDDFFGLSFLIKNHLFDNGEYNPKKWLSNKKLKSRVEQLQIDNFIDFKEKTWALINEITITPICCVCGNKAKFISISKGFRKTCSIKCGSSNPERQQKIKETNIEKYGVENVFQSEVIKEKIKETNLEKYGTENVFQSSKIKEKIKETNIERYGVENVFQSAEVKEKIKETNLERYGVENVLQSQEIKQKIKETNLEKYSAENVFQASEIKEKIKETNIEKYGTFSANQSDLIKNKISSTKITNFRDNILPIRLQQLLDDFDIVPFNWNIADWEGFNKPGGYQFLHKKCNKNFNATIKDGTIPCCPYCSKNRSKVEQKLSNYLENYFQVKINDRTQIAPYEIDILIENIGIEVNGIYYHHEDRIQKLSLLDKTNLAKQKEIQLLHFWDYELNQKFEICTSIIRAKLGSFDKKIMARKCKIKNLTSTEASIFFNKNHLQGHTRAGYYLGLIYENEIVMALSIGRSRFNKNFNIELHRLASKLNTTIIGGIKKLFSQVEKDFKHQILLCYADKRYSIGEIYKRLGFEEQKDTIPNYSWVKREEVIHCYASQKLKKILGDKFDKNLPEEDNMIKNGYFKLKDCGNKAFIKKL